MDFLVEAKDASVHVLNPISPAFTASMEIARMVVREHFAEPAGTAGEAAFVRPAWALSWRWKSSRDQAIESEANGNCARVTALAPSAGSVADLACCSSPCARRIPAAACRTDGFRWLA